MPIALINFFQINHIVIIFLLNKYTLYRYLATGKSFKSLQGQFRIEVSTICNIIHKVLKCIWNTLQEEVLKAPNCPNDWNKIIKGVEGKWQFPHCWGAMDGRLVVKEVINHYLDENSFN